MPQDRQAGWSTVSIRPAGRKLIDRFRAVLANEKGLGSVKVADAIEVAMKEAIDARRRKK